MLEIDHPELKSLYELWQRKKPAGKAMPPPVAIEQEELWPWLPNLAVVEVEDRPKRRFHYTNVGAELVRVLGLELSGRYLDQTPLIFRKFATPAYEELMSERATTFSKVEGFIPIIRVRYRRLMLPLSADGQRISTILAAFYPY